MYIMGIRTLAVDGKCVHYMMDKYQVKFGCVFGGRVGIHMAHATYALLNVTYGIMLCVVYVR